MICKVKNTVEKYGLITDKTKTVAVGLSGGADSVCLLHILSSLKEEYGIILKAVHINHNIRGEEADGDEEFVRRLCDGLGVELFVHSVDVPALAKEKKLSVEECGRQVRYECFEKAGCDAVAVAHTLSDSIETFLFNLARGTGAKGLSGITPKRAPNIIRPVIECTRDEIEAYCREYGLSYVTDSTNLCDDYTRNHIRHNLVPAFAKINSDFEGSFSRAMDAVRQQDSYVEQCAVKLISDSKTDCGYSLDTIKNSHEAVLKRAILILLKEKMSKPPEAKHIDSVYGAILNGKGKIELGKDLYILLKGDIITFCCDTAPCDEWKSLFVDGVAETPYGTFVLQYGNAVSRNSFDADKLESELFVSSRQAGDKFTFTDRKITKSLKKLFNEKKIPVKNRNRIAVLHDGNNVVWVEDIGVNSMYIPDEKSQKIITIKKDGVKC